MNVEPMARWCSLTVALLLLGCDPQTSDEEDVLIADGEESLEFSQDSELVGELDVVEDELPTAGCNGGPNPRNSNEVKFCNEEGEPVIAHVAYPNGTPPAEGWPTVVVLHGSGGLYKQLKKSDPSLGACSDQLESQFAEWKKTLTAEGYAVVMPASFYSRGFCDWNKDAKKIPKGLAKDDRLLFRLWDARAAAKWACDNAKVDCDRMAVMGFSNGGSATLISMHDDLSTVKDKRYNKHGTQEWFVGGIAYYPGCGMQGALTYSLKAKDKGKFYSPQAPVIVHHAEKDPLLDDCAEIRDPQVEMIAKEKHGGEDWFDLIIHKGAGHGFDNDKGKAKDTARAATLAQLAEWLK